MLDASSLSIHFLDASFGGSHAAEIVEAYR
jgi:hypothetical protein